MRIEANGAIYEIKSENHDYESQTSELVRQIWNAHIRARDFIKKFIGALYHIEILCSKSQDIGLPREVLLILGTF